MAEKHQSKPYPAPFSLRLSDAEREALDKMAAGKPLGQFIKDAIFGQGFRPLAPQESQISDKQILAKLLGALGQSRISANINQLARAANSGSLPVNQEVLKSLNEAAAAVLWMRDCLIKGMGLKPQTPLPMQNQEEHSHDPER